MFTSRRWTWVIFGLLLLLALLISGCDGLIHSIAPEFNYQGRLLDETGNPVSDGNYEIEYKLYHAETGGTAVYTETETVQVKDGLFTSIIGPHVDLDPEIFTQPTWMEVTVKGETLAPRQKLRGAPIAFSLTAGAVVQGPETRERSFLGQDDTGAALTVWNRDFSDKGGHAILAVNQAAPTYSNRGKTAALVAIAAGGKNKDTGGDPDSGAYGAIIRSENYHGLYAQGSTGDSANYYAGVFTSKSGIFLSGGGSCVNCTMAYLGYNAGEAAIEPGDFVSLLGVERDEEFGVPVMQVQKAEPGGTAVIGVATAAATREAIDEVYGDQVGAFNQLQGTAAAGSYVNVVVQGLVQADVGSASGMELGQQLQGAQSVQAAAGRLMSAPDDEGMAWVMLSGQ